MLKSSLIKPLSTAVIIRMSSTMSNRWRPRYFDIGVNFSDSMFQGYYNGSSTPKHPADIDKVIERAHTFNVDKMLITASSIKESEEHFDLCERYSNNFSSTVGVHPCAVAQEFYTKDEEKNEYTDKILPEVEEKLRRLKELVVVGHERGYVKAFGEIGLDYDRLHFSNKNQQTTMFKKQLDVIASLKHLKMPLFLHMRNACDDFITIIKPYIENGDIEKGNGVVHSFTGTKEELDKLLDLGFYIGINGCSLKTVENLQVASSIPKSKLMVETDAPWCEIRKSHASYKFITSYPNKFYPEIQVSKSEVLEVDNMETIENSEKPLRKEKKKQTVSKQAQIKLDDFLPFPSIKKDNYAKHQTTIETLLRHNDPNTINDEIGEFASPLIKSRNEPVFVGYVAEIMCELYDIKEDKEIEEFIDLVYENSCRLFKI